MEGHSLLLAGGARVRWEQVGALPLCLSVSLPLCLSASLPLCLYFWHLSVSLRS